ncbi:MAG: hypothetical protein ACKO3W_14855 [bacterium]
MLTNSGASTCRYNVTNWTLDVSGAASEADVIDWTITATRGATSSDKLRVTGFLTVTNGGVAPATIGNIVLNLQRKQGNNWLSAAANVADSFTGDNATIGRCCSQASSEGRSFFAENAGSGSLEFIDVDNNTIFSMVPQPTLAAGQTVTLRYTAEYNSTALGLMTGTSMRVEALVSFGNSGRRGSGGASCTSIDVSGDGVLSADEANVRTVATRTTISVPAVEPVNDAVTLVADAAALVVGGNVVVDGYSTDIGAGGELSSETTSASIVRHVWTPFTATEPGGFVEFCVGMSGNSSSCVEGSNYSDCGRVDIIIETGCPAVFCDGDYTTYSKGGYQGNGVPGQLLISSFSTAFPTGLVIGQEPGFSARWTDVAKLRSFMNQGGPSGRLTADTLNATSTAGGNLAGQTAALTVNVALASGFGNLRLCGAAYQSTGVAGDSVATILGKINTYMSGGALPTGMNASALNSLADKLNTSFEAGVVSTWAIDNLCP